LSDDPPKAAPTAVGVALGGLCPRCGARTLFNGLLAFAPSCRACGLDLSTFNVGDGAVAFLTLIVGAMVGAMAITAQLTFHLPFWVHAILWVPVAAVLVIGLLRVAKALLLALEYRHRAAEGHITRSDDGA
jgi:uncharacterized protein (DUF983 family)